MKATALLLLVLLASCSAVRMPAVVAADGVPAPRLPWSSTAAIELRAVCKQPAFEAAFTLVARSRDGDELRLAGLDELGTTLFTAVHAGGHVEVRSCSPRLPSSLAEALCAGLAAVLCPPASLAAVHTDDGALAAHAQRGASELLYAAITARGGRVQCGVDGRLVATVDVEVAVTPFGQRLQHLRLVDVRSGLVVTAEPVTPATGR